MQDAADAQHWSEVEQGMVQQQHLRCVSEAAQHMSPMLPRSHVHLSHVSKFVQAIRGACEKGFAGGGACQQPGV